MDITYNVTERYRTWEDNYSYLIRGLWENNVSPNSFDEISVEFQNVEDRIHVLEEQVTQYKEQHRTPLYFTLHDAKNELEGKLDRIELNSQEDLRQERRHCFDRVATLSRDLDSKIHQESIHCPDCFKRVILVPYVKASN